MKSEQGRSGILRERPTLERFAFISLAFPSLLVRLIDADAAAAPAPAGGDPASSGADVSHVAAGGFRRIAAPLDRANFRGLVLGCIEAKYCK